MSLLGPVGTCQYSTVDMNVAETETTGFVQKAVYDSAGRTVVYVETTLTIRSTYYVDPSGTTNNDGSTADTDTNRVADVLKQVLMQPGGQLIWQGKGGGTLRANVPGEASRDVMYGPRPQSFQLTKIFNQRIEFVWTVIVCLPTQCAIASFSGVPMEVNTKVGFAIDGSGWTKRTYSGHLMIPTTRSDVANKNLVDVADSYRSLIVPAPIFGFRRESSDFTLNEAKNRLDFSVTDMEMASNIPPRNVIAVSASHEHSTQIIGNFLAYGGTIQADYELQKGASAADVFQAFLRLYQDRKGHIQKRINELGGSVKTAYILPVSFSASEPDIYGKPKARFTLSYAVTLPNFAFLTDGLWQPDYDNTWDAWNASMAIHSADGRGLAGLKFDTTQDKIVDLCSFPTSAKMTSQPTAKTVPGVGGIPIDVPPPESSYMFYINEIFYEDETGVIVQKPLPNQEISKTDGAANGPNVEATAFTPIKIDKAPDLIINRRAGDSIYVVMIGRALRAMWKIAPPKLVSVGGVPAIPANKPGDGFVQATVGNVGVPLYGASWRFTYVLTKAPTEATPPENPVISAAIAGAVAGAGDAASGGASASAASAGYQAASSLPSDGDQLNAINGTSVFGDSALSGALFGGASGVGGGSTAFPP
jgi:hypothetical protein